MPDDSRTGPRRPTRGRSDASPTRSASGLLSELVATPAYAIDERWRIVAWNAAASVVFGDFAEVPEAERHCLRQHLLGESFRSRIEEPEAMLAYVAALYRYTTAEHAAARWRRACVTALLEASADFRAI